MTLRGVLFDFGLTLAYPPPFAGLVRRATADLGRDDTLVSTFIDAIYAVESHPDVRAAEARRDHSADGGAVAALMPTLVLPASGARRGQGSGPRQRARRRMTCV